MGVRSETAKRSGPQDRAPRSRRCSSTSPPRRPSRSARKCLQIHGGNGYMKEYGAEKLLRDALVMPIYEGTSQIQALMAMKDTLVGIIKNPQEFVTPAAQARWRAVSRATRSSAAWPSSQVQSLAVQQYLMARTAGDKVKSLRTSRSRSGAPSSRRTGTRSATSPSPCCTPSGSPGSSSTRRSRRSCSRRRKEHPERRDSSGALPRARRGAEPAPGRRDHDHRQLATPRAARREAAPAKRRAKRELSAWPLQRSTCSLSGRVIGALGARRRARQRSKSRTGHAGHAGAGDPPPRLRLRATIWSRDFVRLVGGDPGAYKTSASAAPFPAVGISRWCCARSRACRTRWRASSTAAARFESTRPLPKGEALDVTARLVEVDDNGRRASHPGRSRHRARARRRMRSSRAIFARSYRSAKQDDKGSAASDKDAAASPMRGSRDRASSICRSARVSTSRRRPATSTRSTGRRATRKPWAFEA